MPVCSPETWELIKAEYIAGGTSYGILANKYGISKASIQRRAATEGWQNLRESIRINTESAVQEHIQNERVDRFVRLYDMADTAQQRIS